MCATTVGCILLLSQLPIGEHLECGELEREASSSSEHGEAFCKSRHIARLEDAASDKACAQR